MGSWGIGHWIVVLIIVLLVFGTRRLTSGAKDLGKAVNEFKKGVRGEEEQKPAEQLQDASRAPSGAEAETKPESEHDTAPR